VFYLRKSKVKLKFVEDKTKRRSLRSKISIHRL